MWWPPAAPCASEQILSTIPGATQAMVGKAGPAMAAPHVTGAAGASACSDNRGSPLTEVLDLLQSTALPLPGYSPQEQGAGVIDVEGMVNALQ